MKFFEEVRKSKLIPAVTLTYILISSFYQDVVFKVTWFRYFNIIFLMILLTLTAIELYFTSKGIMKELEEEEIDDHF